MKRSLILMGVLAFAALAGSCNRIEARISRDGSPYVLQRVHPATETALRELSMSTDDLKNQADEFGGQFAEMHGRSDKRFFAPVDEASVMGFGPSVAYGEKREDGSRLARSQGFWLWYFKQGEADTFSITQLDQVREDADGGSYALSFLYLPERWSIESAGAYQDGERTGPWLFWYADGKRRGRGEFEAGEMVGPWTVWKEDGSVDEVLTGVYESGVKSNP